jgi:hypothetical protein
MVCKILSPNDLEVKIDLDNKRLTGGCALLACTASALTMIGALDFEVKVGFHKAL